MVGSPGIMKEGRQARHFCGFPGDLDVQPARIAGPLYAGPLLDQLRFQPESAFHLPAFRVVRLPPWGFGRPTALAPSPQEATPIVGLGELKKMLQDPNIVMMARANPAFVEQALAHPTVQLALEADPDLRQQVKD